MKYKIKFLIPNPEENCYGWWFNDEAICGEFYRTPYLLEKEEYIKLDWEEGVIEQEYAVSRGWA